MYINLNKCNIKGMTKLIKAIMIIGNNIQALNLSSLDKMVNPLGYCVLAKL
jgi:hypothetical protein